MKYILSKICYIDKEVKNSSNISKKEREITLKIMRSFYEKLFLNKNDILTKREDVNIASNVINNIIKSDKIMIDEMYCEFIKEFNELFDNKTLKMQMQVT